MWTFPFGNEPPWMSHGLYGTNQNNPPKPCPFWLFDCCPPKRDTSVLWAPTWQTESQRQAPPNQSCASNQPRPAKCQNPPHNACGPSVQVAEMWPNRDTACLYSGFSCAEPFSQNVWTINVWFFCWLCKDDNTLCNHNVLREKAFQPNTSNRHAFPNRHQRVPLQDPYLEVWNAEACKFWKMVSLGGPCWEEGARGDGCFWGMR